MDFEKLAAFQAVAAEQSFSRAAAKLYRTQPAISQAVRLLEDDIGEPLFIRQGRTVELTPVGRILLEHVGQAFDVLSRARADVAARRELRQGELTIAASDTTACYFLPEILGLFHVRYPRVEIRISNRPSPVAAEEVAARRADIGIVTLPIEHPKLSSEPLAIREDVVICAPSHRLAGKKRFDFQMLQDYPLLLLDRGSNTRSFIDQRLAQAGLQPRIAMELGSIEVIKRLVQLNFGISIVPRIAVQDELDRGTLRAFTIFKKQECRTLGVIYPAKGIASRAGQVFVEMLKAHSVENGSL